MLTIWPTCFDWQYLKKKKFCMHSVNKLLWIVLKNCGNKCVSIISKVSASRYVLHNTVLNLNYTTWYESRKYELGFNSDGYQLEHK